MKKIAFITSIYMEENFYTGGEKLNYNFLSALKAKGFAIDIYIIKKMPKNYQVPANVYLISEKGYPNSDDYDYIVSEKAGYKSDLTYLHGFSYIYREPIVYSAFRLFLNKIYQKKKKVQHDKFSERKRNLEEIKNVIVSSNALKKDVIENWGVPESRVFVVHPAIDISANEEIAPLNTDTTVFGMVAVGFAHKGGYIALNAINKLKKKCKNFKVRVIYPSDNFFVKLLIKFYGIEKNVEFLPISDNINDFYRSLDCVLIPSLIDTFNMVATEAMACGRPAIISQRCGACDLIQEGVNGLVFDFDKNPSTQLALKMEKFIKMSYEAKKQLSENAKNTVKNMTWNNFADKIIAILEQ